MEHISTFEAGLDMDLNKAILPKNKYRNAKNIYIVTSGLDSTGAIHNSNGNVSSFRIPTTSNVIKLVGPVNTSINVQININGAPINTSVNANQEFQDISEAINADATLQTLGITSAYSNTYVLIYSKVNANNQTTTPNIVVSGLVNISQSGSPYIPAQANPIITGYTTIRDDFILFTTSDTSKNPGGQDSTTTATATSAGQIWRLAYNPVSFVPTLTLLYNNYIDFTTFHPIPYSAAEGRYESSGIQNAYWTDNFNELRRFNTSDLNGFGLDPTLLSITPQADYDVPILQSIQGGGSLKTGAYQAAYRYKNTGGATTIYSKTSNIVPIINGLPDSTPFRKYVADGSSNSGKSITWNIDNLDTDYERLEIVILYREERDDVAIIDQVFDEPVPDSGSFTFTYTGTEPTLPVDLNIFLDVNSSFTHCKTIVSKDNQLLAGNTKNITFDVDFDARAYRWRHITSPSSPQSLFPYSPTTTEVIDSQGTVQIVDTAINPTGFPAWDVPETHDAINPDQYTQTPNSYRFQSDGLTIGGSGPNISYEFNTRYFVGDDVIGFPSFASPPYGENSRFVNNNPGPFLLNSESYKNNNFYGSFKSPYISSAFKGYQHHEIYPFAIQFFDLQGRPGFSKWIGDIRCPLIFESIDNGITTYSTYSISDRNTSNNAQQVGILLPEFTVTIPANLQNKISGWHIVRCERTTEDKTILAAGTIHPVTFDFSANTYYTEGTVNDSFITGAEQKIVGFRSPEFSFLQFPGYKIGDKLVFAAKQNNSHVTSASGSPAEFLFVKNYDLFQPNVGNSSILSGFPNNERLLGPDAAIFLDRGASTSFANATISNTSSVNPQYSIGDQTVILDFRGDAAIPYLPLTPSGAQPFDKYYAYYHRTRASQYGGNTYSARSSRQYISCGQYQEITPLTPSLTFTVEIAGGDIYTTIWDFQKRIKGYVGGPFATSSKKSISYFAPIETVLNIEWRGLNTVNGSGMPNVGAGGVDVGDDYILFNDGFAFEDNIKKSYPKPAVFTDIQEYDTRVHISGVKINGEINDSWGLFAPNDYRDAEGNKGPITSLIYFKDHIYCIQHNAISVLPINQKASIPDNTSTTLVLGTGQGVGKPVYLSTVDGSRHQWSCIASDTGVYFFDVKNKAISRIRSSSEPLTIIKGVDSYFQRNLLGDILIKDNPIHDTGTDLRTGVTACYNPFIGDILFTFHDVQNNIKSSFTIAYDETIEAFTSFYDFMPTIYLNDKRNLFSSNNGNQVWLHEYGNKGQYYGTNFNSSVSFLVNSEPASTKVFDMIEWNTSVLDPNNINTNFVNETWSTLKCLTDHQNSDILTLTPGTTTKRRERIWNTQVPRDKIIQNLSSVDITNSANINPSQLFTSRLRDYYMLNELTFQNFKNNAYRELICPYVKCSYRPSIH